MYFFYDTNWRYNWLDFAILLLGLNSLAFGWVPHLSWMRTLRVLKVTKALRVFRLIAMIRPLRELLVALLHTIDKLFWSIVLLILVMFLFSLAFVIRVTSFLTESGHDDIVMSKGNTAKEALAEHFGSVSVTMVHLFMCITGGNDWSIYYMALEHTGTLNCMIFLLFIAFTEIALCNIILGIFVDSAIKNVVTDKDDKAERHAEEQQKVRARLLKLCYQLDEDGDGRLTPVEWRRAIRNARVKRHLEMMDFRASDVKQFIDYMCAGHDEEAIHIEKFVDSVLRFRGSSSCFDMQIVLHAIHELKTSLQCPADSAPRDPRAQYPRDSRAQDPRYSGA